MSTEWIYRRLGKMTRGKTTYILPAHDTLRLTIDSNPTEYMPLTDTYSPVLHRIDQAVRFRAVHPSEPIPPPYEILTRYSKPPNDLVEKSKRQLERLVEAANVKKGTFPLSPTHTTKCPLAS